MRNQLRIAAHQRLAQTTMDKQRLERLVGMLTPETEQAIQCLTEAIALGLIVLPKSPRETGRY